MLPLLPPTHLRLLSASLTSVSSLVFLQLFSRIFTFRSQPGPRAPCHPPQTFGTRNQSNSSYCSRTTLFPVPRGRAHRPAAPAERAFRLNLTPQHIALLPAYVCASAVRDQQHFHLSVSIYAFAAALELAAAPLYIRAQNELRVDVRVRAEGAAVFSKTLATFLGLAFAPPSIGRSSLSLRDRLPTPSPRDRGHKKDAYFDQELLHLSGAMTAQSVVKHFLTEGDKLLISRLSPLADQGGYAIASNYGSLVARVVFQPIEETSRIFFSKSLSSSSSSSSSENDQEALQTAVELLSTLLLLFTHFLLLLLVFGPPYLPLATALVLPPRYQQTSAPRILRAFRFYLPAMAYNGVLEAFLASVCTPADLRAQSRMMAAASAALIATALAGARVFGAGDVALVWANTASMAVRALYAWRFARKFCEARAVPHRQRETERALGLAALRPPLGVLVAFAAAAVCTRWSAAAHADVRLSLWAQRWHVAMGSACLGVCLVVCYMLERRRFLRTIAVLRRSRK
ncbi:Rft-1-domain-containing protein [Lactarius hengduanensis]|nr:Rft-1-domain-containing protein [Lactarius hengduanensis]